MWRAHSFWQAPHRPLFLLAALAAFGVPAVWIVPPGAGPDPVAWHLHELMFAMGGAAIGGYVLTALPAWTQDGPVAPRVTAAMCVLWGLARVSFAAAEQVPGAAVIIGTQAYLAALMALVSWKIVAQRIWPKAYLVLAMAMLMAADVIYLARLHGSGGEASGATELVLSFAFLISMVGGRAVPAFTRSWLARQSAPTRMCDSRMLSGLATGALAAGTVLSGVGRPGAAGVLLMLSGGLQAIRMLRWQALSVCRYPALLLLHLAWIWLPAGLLLVGLAMVRPEWIARPPALHALTMGAMGTMILAVMARSLMPRRNDRLVLGKRLAAAFAAVWLSALLRVMAPFAPPWLQDPIATCALLWMAGWALFLWAYLSARARPDPWPVLSARLPRDRGPG